MPDDSSATCCTNYANHVRSTLGAIGYEVNVVGFANEDNPSSRCAKEEFHPGGHDFAIVSQRYLVDPWVRLVACVEDQIVYDLFDDGQAAKALEIYGPRHCWLPLPINPNYRFSPDTPVENDFKPGHSAEFATNCIVSEVEEEIASPGP